ncbi:MAG: AAA family ATPase [Candidatus Tectomicrobia bacterium]|nr:AAA family ATPase [Candidatus Tectomicrobia bacterium]
MRIKSIQLSWFRGAADPVALDPDSKSMVVYGNNGAGKSSFVDAVEYVLHNGRIGHLSHEYSGKHQEKAIPNTHKPRDRKTELRITFTNDAELTVQIKPDGSPKSSGAEVVAMPTWEYHRTVLRQDEVAAFIHDTKGDKYSTLLPLLGLHQMEVAAENLRQLSKMIAQQSKFEDTKVALGRIKNSRAATFGADNDDQIASKIATLHARYCANEATTKDPLSRCKELEAELETRIDRSLADQRRNFALQDVAEINLKHCIDAVRSVSMKFADSVDPLIAEKLEVLQTTVTFLDKLGEAKEVNCPACGRAIPLENLQAHLKSERERLHKIINVYNTRKAEVGTLCDTCKSLQSNLSKPAIKAWRDEITKGPLADRIAFLDSFNVDVLRTSCNDADLKTLEANLLPVINLARKAWEDAPPDVRQLSTDRQTVEVGKAVIEGKGQAAAVARAEALRDFVSSLEKGVREEIRLRSQKVIEDISVDIQSMWSILHPGEPIENVRLYFPNDVDKAIDIGLNFHGHEQESPRLTLSEGYRNSLGLCIFLAMAKREAKMDRPLFLDDVVISLDRNHRGMIRELLEKEFAKRQVVILTHDREWYTELRQQLHGNSWTFKTLLPYETPTVGIRWSHKTTTFDDARAQLNDRPDSAGTDARKIMDVELALIAERLRIRLPYLRAEKNDKRIAHDFLDRFVADGKKCFRKKVGQEYVAHSDATGALDKADRLLVSWANRGTHTLDLVRQEAVKVIDACEKALESFICSSCRRGVWLADAESAEWVQCQCGEIQWRYGKG